MIIRRLRAADAAAYLELVNTTDVESDFMMQEPGERQMTAFQLVISINSPANNIFVAEENGKLIGQLIAFNMYGRNKRVIHVVHIGI